jgi:hypothetical protein
MVISFNTHALLAHDGPKKTGVSAAKGVQHRNRIEKEWGGAHQRPAAQAWADYSFTPVM